MPDTTDPILELSRQCLRVIRDVEHLRLEAREMEWQASPRTMAEGRRGGKALHTDPTSMIATDENRLALRDALRNTEEDLLRARNHLLAAKGRVTKAVEGWRG